MEEPGGQPAQAEPVERERWPYLWLLVAQVFFIFVTPFVSDSGLGQVFLQAGVLGIILAGVSAATSTPRLFRLSLLLLLPALVAWLGPDLFTRFIHHAARAVSASVCFVFTSVVITRSVSRHDRITTETVLGGINVYLLIAFAFAMLHAAMMMIWSDAYTVGGVSLHEHLAGQPDSYGWATIIYFSFTTLTTLGYGDVVPVRPMARLVTSAEAVVGQLYVAIFIARIVSLGVSQRMRSS